MTQAAAALDHLHARTPPIVHGDVKPANLVVTNTGKVVLVDLGIRGEAGAHQRAGTRGFMAPEVAGGRALHRRRPTSTDWRRPPWRC